MIDLRSDTVTRPTPAMRRAMAEAEVGDDVFREDPTVRRLEEEGAAAVGVAAALFVPSGTMGNQIALYLLSQGRGGRGARGAEVLCEGRCHLVHYELGAMAALSGLMPRALDTPDGLLEPAAVAAAVRAESELMPRTALLAVENTHNMAGGRLYRRERLEALLAVARRHGLPAHLDGARVFNAAVALDVSAPSLAAGFDSVMFCLSKGLGAPVGSLLCGAEAFIAEARRVRKMLGGGMRQVGVLAAAGLVALREGPDRLAEDHANARRLAAGLAELPGIDLDSTLVETNIVIPRLQDSGSDDPAAAFAAGLRERGVLCAPISRDQVRLVTHRDVSAAEIETALTAARQLVG